MSVEALKISCSCEFNIAVKFEPNIPISSKQFRLIRISSDVINDILINLNFATFSLAKT